MQSTKLCKCFFLDLRHCRHFVDAANFSNTPTSCLVEFDSKTKSTQHSLKSVTECCIIVVPSCEDIVSLDVSFRSFFFFFFLFNPVKILSNLFIRILSRMVCHPKSPTVYTTHSTQLLSDLILNLFKQGKASAAPYCAVLSERTRPLSVRQDSIRTCHTTSLLFIHYFTSKSSA